MAKARKKVTSKTSSKKKASSKGKSKTQLEPKVVAAMYEAYPADFSSQYFSAAEVVQSVKNIKAAGFTRDNLLWGYYQKFAPSDPTDPGSWGNTALYEHWEAAIAEARDDLKKAHVDADQPGPDPDNPRLRARNALEHLDSAVKIALFDKHQLGCPDESGIEVEVLVRMAAKPSRRHKVRTIWRPEGSNPSDPKYKYDKLTIVMTCPRGGWIGTAAWKYTGASRFTQYTAKYRVPDQPERDDGQIIFIFNGLESLPNPQQKNPPGILQPVLQWTSKDKWAIRSWYVPSTYTPTFDEMPELNDERPFTNPASPAWTRAEKVRPGTLLQGVIAWDGMAYRSRFMVGTTSKVELFAPNILPLRYPVAVIEAFRFAGRRTLVDVKMEQIALYREDTGNIPVEPTWDIGTEGDSGDGIHHGTGKLQRYRVVPSANNATLTFTRK